MSNHIDDMTFKKMIDQTSPQSIGTQKLCLRLGYEPTDLVYKSIDQFQCSSQEVQKQKYAHYKNRILRIIQEIQQTKVRHKLGDQSIKQITLTQIQDNQVSSHSEESVSIYEKKEKKIQSRQKILQNLIYLQLQEEKKNVEYLKKQQQKLQNKKNHQSQKSDTSFSKKKINKVINKSRGNEEADEERRNQYFITCSENDSRIQEQISSRFQRKNVKLDNYSERAIEKRKQQESLFEVTISDRLFKLQQKESQAQIKVELYKKDMKNYLAQKNSLINLKQEKRSQLQEFEQQTFINEQCQKMLKFEKKKTVLFQEKQNKLNEQKRKYTMMLNKCQKNVDAQLFKYQEGYEQTYQDLVQKQEKVEINKRKILEQKSLILRDKLALNFEDVEFNRAHVFRLQQNSQIKQNGFKDIKSQQSSRTSETFRIKNQLEQRESENSIWERAKQAAILFKDPKSYDEYIQQQQLILMKKKKELDPKFAQAAQIIKQILPKKEAENILMPSELKDFWEIQNKTKQSK